MEIAPTPAGWLEAVLADFAGFLKDHASCEKKASGMALSIASHYPDRPELLRAMADLAVEELSHYREVVRLLIEHGLCPGPDARDPYIKKMNGLIRRGPEHYLLDRLLIAAIVERRGFERFGLIADALATERPIDLTSMLPRDPQNEPIEAAGCSRDSLTSFYRAITISEGRHWQLFLQLAEQHCTPASHPTDPTIIADRLTELLGEEAHIMQAQCFRAALH